MKTTHILVLGALAALTSCGMIAQSSSSDDGHRFTDGIYSSTPSFRTKEERIAQNQRTKLSSTRLRNLPYISSETRRIQS